MYRLKAELKMCFTEETGFHHKLLVLADRLSLQLLLKINNIEKTE